MVNIIDYYITFFLKQAQHTVTIFQIVSDTLLAKILFDVSSNARVLLLHRF